MAQQVEMKKTLGLTGVTVNAMALIAPGAFMWLTFQMQAAQVDLDGATTAMDTFGGLAVALILGFLTAASFSKLSTLYPESGTGSSYYFTEQAMLNEHRFSPLARLSKFIVGWFSHLYYWVMAGVMVAMMATLITYIVSQFGVDLSPLAQIIIAVLFACLIGYIAYRGITGSTISSMLTNIIQIVCLVAVSILALIYRFKNPEHVTFVFTDFPSIVMPHSLKNMMFQATIAILLLVGFESASALTAESKSPRHIGRAVVISLIIQGVFCYILQYVTTLAWLNTSYTGKDAKDAVVSGIDAAAASSAPVGDMVKNLGDALLGDMGFALLIVVSVAVAIALSGSVLATMNTGVRLTYAMSKDKEIPSFLGVLHPKYATPHTCVLGIVIVSSIIGAFGVLSITNLTAITLISNIGTFVFFGMTNLVALVAFWSNPQRKVWSHILVPVLGALANLSMLVAILYLGMLGGGDTQTAAMIAIVTTAVWIVLGVVCLGIQSSRTQRRIIARPPVTASDTR